MSFNLRRRPTRAYQGALAVHDWWQRLAALIPLRDRLALSSPPILVEKFLSYAISRHKREAPADDPDARNPELVRVAMDLFRAVGRMYFHLEIRGVENVPEKGPVLLVGNHNGALVTTDVFFAELAIWDRFGPLRAVYSMAHDFLFYDPQLRRYALQLGALRAGPTSARRVLDRGDIVLDYPGSDLETFRPWKDRNKIVLGGRKGFLRLALGAGVPIVPVVSAGTHEQLVVLTRGDRLARLLHMHWWARADVCPIVLSFPWGITSGFLPYIPLPAQTALVFGAPMTWPLRSPEDVHDRVVLERCYAEVESVMQSMLDALTVHRRPFLGQPVSVRREQTQARDQTGGPRLS
jgi:1-acyl-sn-glycerol-3-phosphate acyltransferase